MTAIQSNLQSIQLRIHEAECEFNRLSHSVFLLAVSKGQSTSSIEQVIALGQTAFGESYLQEALPKIIALSQHNLEWHFIGPIQRNKTNKIAEHFHWVHSIDNKLIAKRLNDQRPAHLLPLNICIQVNISNESTKSGILIEQVEQLVQECLTLPFLRLRGLMAIPAVKNMFCEQRAEFHKLWTLYDALIKKGVPLDTLSIGMSADMEAAIAEGSTLVRIGTDLFGKRS